jgi:hypothetical protein
MQLILGNPDPEPRTNFVSALRPLIPCFVLFHIRGIPRLVLLLEFVACFELELTHTLTRSPLCLCPFGLNGGEGRSFMDSTRLDAVAYPNLVLVSQTQTARRAWSEWSGAYMYVHMAICYDEGKWRNAGRESRDLFFHAPVSEPIALLSSVCGR